VQQSGDELQTARSVEPLAPAVRARLAELANQVDDPRLRASLEHLLQTAAPDAPAQPDPSAD
jgi:hypothetical protein